MMYIYIYIYIYIYKGGGTHTVACTAHLYSTKHTYLTKSVRNVEIAFLYIMKLVKILSYNVTTLHFMHDIYIRGEAHIQLYVQLICTVPLQLFLFGPLEV